MAQLEALYLGRVLECLRAALCNFVSFASTGLGAVLSALAQIKDVAAKGKELDALKRAAAAAASWGASEALKRALAASVAAASAALAASMSALAETIAIGIAAAVGAAVLVCSGVVYYQYFRDEPNYYGKGIKCGWGI